MGLGSWVWGRVLFRGLQTPVLSGAVYGMHHAGHCGLCKSAPLYGEQMIREGMEIMLETRPDPDAIGAHLIRSPLATRRGNGAKHWE